MWIFRRQIMLIFLNVFNYLLIMKSELFPESFPTKICHENFFSTDEVILETLPMHREKLFRTVFAVFYS